MIGIAIGDYLGSSYERPVFKRKFRFEEPPMLGTILNERKCWFTDDTYLALAQAEALLTGEPFYLVLKKWASYYPNAGYGKMFMEWVKSNKTSYNSFGNGAASRAIVVALAYRDDPIKMQKEVIKFTKQTHNHPQAIKDAVATAFMAILYCRDTPLAGGGGEYLARSATNGLISEYPDLFEIFENEEVLKHSSDYVSKVSIPSARSYPTVVNALGILTEPMISGESFISKALALNEDPDTQAAIVGGIIYNAIDHKWVEEQERLNYGWYDLPLHDIAEIVLDKFDSRMLYWYEKYCKTYNLN